VIFRSPPWDGVVYWALDLETGGLDVRRNAILAVGMVPIREGVIRLGEAYHTLVRPEGGGRIDPGSVQAHQLLWGDVQEGRPLEEVLAEVARRLSEGVLLVHHRGIDEAFLKRAFRHKGMAWPRPKVVDTVELLLRVARFTAPDQPRTLNLSAARKRYGLPAYQAHDAFTDAVATAELFLVLRKSLGARTLRDLR
jgi:DNA polymerase-3 subunit epsilon